MGIRRIVVTQRASETDEWYYNMPQMPHRMPELPQYIKENFVNTGLLTRSFLFQVPPNDLRRITVWEWPDQQAHDAWYADPKIQEYEQSRIDFYAGQPGVNVVFDQIESTDIEFNSADYYYRDFG